MNDFEYNEFNELNLILNSLSDGIYIADEKGYFIAINDMAASLENLNVSDFIGKNAKLLIEQGILQEDEVMTLKVIKSGELTHQYKKSHNGRMIMTTGIPIYKNGTLFRIIVQERDITAITNLQEELNDLTKLKGRIEEELSLLSEINNKNSRIVYKSKEIETLLQICLRIANVDTTVLITGESGTGKGVFARYIHDCSFRKDNNFVKIDCTAIPANLFESELFGYEAGSFTGANKDGKCGLIELAHKGTLFIDEIGDLPLSLQTKLLTVIQEKKFYRIGGKQPIPVDIRIITATNQPLESMVNQRLFREDLYYRLNVVPINIPPLRERLDDIYPLSMYFLNVFNKKYKLKKKLSPKTLDTLMHQPWKGNVRELENTIERLVVTTASDVLSTEDLPNSFIRHQINESVNTPHPIQSYQDSFSAFEKELLVNVMNHCNSTKEMSQILNIAPNTITTKLKKYGIRIPYKKGPKEKGVQ